MAFQRFLCVAERSTMTQSLQRQRYHTDIERRGIIISNFLECKKDQRKRFMVHLWDMLNRPDTGEYEKAPIVSKT